MNATAEALSFQDVVDHLGRSDVVGSYHDGLYSHSDEKHAERERVLDFVAGYFQPDEYLRLLSLPGTDWTFEAMLLRTHPLAQLVGLERSFSIYARSRRAMPRGPRDLVPEGQHLQDRVMAYGSGTVVYSRIAANRRGGNKCAKRSVRSNRLLLMDAATYASMLATDYGATMEQKKEFSDKFYRRGAAWLDFTGTLSVGVEQTLRWLHLCIDPMVAAAPVVITLRNGRDAFSGAASRIRRICELQPEFVPADHWTYIGKGGVSMLTVCGEFRSLSSQ